MEKITQKELVKEFFRKHPNKEINQKDVAAWLTENYKQLTDKDFGDPQRAVRKLHQHGFLMKIRKGVYKYDPDFVENRQLEDFTPSQKKAIFERDGYKCAVCGLGIKEGLELHVDHIKPNL